MKIFKLNYKVELVGYYSTNYKVFVEPSPKIVLQLIETDGKEKIYYR